MELRISSDITSDSIVDGPGLRTVIWTQGCYHNCDGCHNKEAHSFEDGTLIKVRNLVKEIKDIKLNTGVTISGGEPFEQVEPLIKLCKSLKRLKKDIWIYSGYTFEELTDRENINYERNIDLLNLIDVLVDGKYVKARRDMLLKFRGSDNQRIIDVKKSLKSDKVVILEKYIKDHIHL